MSGTKSKRQQALDIAKDLRLKVQGDQNKLSTLLMGCKTVCRYLGNLHKNLWIDDELKGYEVTKFKNYREQNEALPEYRKVSCIYYNEYDRPLIFPGSKSESNLSVFKIPNAITELETLDDLLITGGPMLDLVNIMNSKSHFKVIKAVVTNNHIHAVLTGVRNRIYEFLDETILELEFGEIPEMIFENIREEVDSKMVTLGPNAISMLQTAYENVKSDDPDSWSNVASGCRRIIKEVADIIFPARTNIIEIDGEEIKVDDSKYINRIYAGLKLKSSSGTTLEFNRSMIEYIFSFLRNIQSYSSKGDHSEFTKMDATRCVVYTYLLLGDILRYYVESEAVTKILGKPDNRKEGVQKYSNRTTAPFEELLFEAKEEILFVSTSHEFVAKYNKKLMRELIENNLIITVIVLNPNSDEIKSKESLFEISNIRDLVKVINEALNELCGFKTSLGDKKSKLIIKTYDSNVRYSYIVIDPHSDNAIIKVEELPGDNPENRKSYLAYRKDNSKFFQEHWDEINNIKDIKTYDCK